MEEKEYNTMYDAPHTAHRRCSFLTCYASATLLDKVLHAIRGSVLPQMHPVAWQQLCNFFYLFFFFKWNGILWCLRINHPFFCRGCHICSGCRCNPGGAKRTERAQHVWLFCFTQACTGNSASSKWKDMIHKSLWNIEIMIKPGTEKLDFQLTLK